MNAESWGCSLDNVRIVKGDGKDQFKLAVPNLRFEFSNAQHVRYPIMGKTGSGKSTLLNLMSAMEWPESGTISWIFPDGETFRWSKQGLSSRLAKQLRSKYFGFAFQDSSLIPHLNILDNLCYPLRIKSLPPANPVAYALRELRKVLVNGEKASSICRKYPFQLSGGQKQRIALVQAVIHDPCVLFADEPTGSLDSETREQVMEVLYSWVKSSTNDKALFWVTHHDEDRYDAGIKKYIEVAEARCKVLNVAAASNASAQLVKK